MTIPERNKLALRYFPLVDQIVFKHFSQNWAFGRVKDDLIAEGRLALLRFLPDFDASRGEIVPFLKTAIRLRLYRVLRKYLNNDVSLDSEIADGINLGDVIGGESPDNRELCDVDKILVCLKPTEREVLKLRFCGEKSLAFREIGKRLNLSKQGVYYLERVGLKKLRRLFRRAEKLAEINSDGAEAGKVSVSGM